MLLSDDFPTEAPETIRGRASIREPSGSKSPRRAVHAENEVSGGRRTIEPALRAGEVVRTAFSVAFARE